MCAILMKIKTKLFNTALLSERQNMETIVIPEQFWDNETKSWNTHEALKTTNHWHICIYDDESCDIAVVEIDDGKGYFIDDSHGDAPEKEFVFSPSNKACNIVCVFADFDECWNQACKIVSEITKTDLKEVIRRNGG